MTDTLADLTTGTGHDESCLCVPCMMADLDAHIVATRGPEALDRVNTDLAGRRTDTAERTRYATPGTRAGRGVVRTASPKQVRLIKKLMAERDTRNLTRLPGSENIERMSLAGARDLIDRLFACPERPGAASEDRGSDKQRAFAKSLIERKGARRDANPDTMTRAEIRRFIDDMLTRPDAPRKAAATDRREALTPGLYRKGGQLVKLQTSRTSGNLYGLVWSAYAEPEQTRKGLKYGEFVYTPGVMRGLTADDKLTLDEAKRMGHEQNFCRVCGIELTHPDSIAAGIGPICASKY